MDYPTPFQKKTLWAAATGGGLFLIGAMVVIVVALIGRVLGFLSPILIPIAIAFIAAFLLDPLVRWFQRRKLSRTKSVISVMSLVMFAALLFGLIIIPTAIHDLGRITDAESRGKLVTKIGKGLDAAQDNRFLAPVVLWLAKDTKQSAPTKPEEKTSLPSAEEDSDQVPENAETSPEASPPVDSKSDFSRISWQNSRLFAWITEHSDVFGKKAVDLIRSGGSTVVGMIGMIIGLVMVPVFTFFFLKEADSIREHWHEYLPLRTSTFKDEIVDVLKEINSYLIAFFRGQVVVSLIDGILTGIALKALGLPYAISIGIALAVLGIIPFIGIIVTFVPAALIALGHFGDWQHVFYVALIFLAVQQIDGFLIQPKIVGDSVGLHPLTVIFSVLLWSLLLGGFIGALLAVPMTAAVKVLFGRYIWQKKLKPLEETAALVT